jgi:hypothetical protein
MRRHKTICCDEHIIPLNDESDIKGMQNRDEESWRSRMPQTQLLKAPGERRTPSASSKGLAVK